MRALIVGARFHRVARPSEETELGSVVVGPPVAGRVARACFDAGILIEYGFKTHLEKYKSVKNNLCLYCTYCIE